MNPLTDSVWFAKMKESNKNLIITKYDDDLVNSYILSTGFLGIKSTDKLPLPLLTSIIISDEFRKQRDLNSVGTTMAGINNETFKKILVPKLEINEINEFNKKYQHHIYHISYLRKKIKKLQNIKTILLSKYF